MRLIKSSLYVMSGGIFVVLTSAMSILKYHNLHTLIYDLGVYDRNIWGISRFNLSYLFEGHFHPVLIIYGLLYLIYPAPHLLLILQSLTIASAIIPFVLIAKRTLAEKECAFFFLAFLLYPPLWFNALFDFHPDHLVIPLFFWAIYFVEQEKIMLSVLFSAITIVVKEIFPFVVCFWGIYLLMRYKQYVLGTAMALFSVLIAIVAIDIIIPYFTCGKSVLTFQSGFTYLGEDIQSILLNIIQHPLTVLGNLSNPLKILYLIKIGGPLLFVPFLSPWELLPALPLVAFALISQDPDHYCACGQYDAGIIPFVFWAGMRGFNRLKQYSPTNGMVSKLPLFITVASGLFHVALSPSPVSRLFWLNEQAFTYHYRAYLPNKRSAIIKQAIDRYLPEDAGVSVSTQTTVNRSRLTHRHKMFVFPEAVIAPYRMCNGELVFADYVVLDGKTPPFMYDMINPEAYRRLVIETRDRYRTVYAYDQFMILKNP